METPFPNLPTDGNAGNTAYIRRIKADHLPKELRAEVPEGIEIWGIHDTEGQCLALTQDRAVAFVVARQNDLCPVSVH